MNKYLKKAITLIGFFTFPVWGLIYILYKSVEEMLWDGGHGILKKFDK